jgi:polar amino acid transport system permease protein
LITLDGRAGRVAAAAQGRGVDAGLTASLAVIVGTGCWASPAPGFAGALRRHAGATWLQALVGGYVELIRNTPFIVQLFFIFFGLPAAGFKLSPKPRRSSRW